MRASVVLVLLAVLAAGCSDGDPAPGPTPASPTVDPDPDRGTGEVAPPPPARTDEEVHARVRVGIAAAQAGDPIPTATAPSVRRLKADESKGDGRCKAAYARDAPLELCERGTLGGPRTMVVFGDSHARQWGTPLDTIAKRHGYSAYHLIRLGCPAADIVPWENDGDEPNFSCEQFHQWAIGQVRLLRPDVVVLATSFNPDGYYVDGEHVLDETTRFTLLRDAMSRLMRQLSPYVGRFLVIGDPPAVALAPARCLLRPTATLRRCSTYGTETSLTANETVEGAVTDVAGELDARFVPTEDWFCVDHFCSTVLGELLPYKDPNHVSNTYAQYLTEVLDTRLGLGP